jgi:hypothetical protein
VKKVVIGIIVLEKQEMDQMKKCGDCVLGPGENPGGERRGEGEW